MGYYTNYELVVLAPGGEWYVDGSSLEDVADEPGPFREIAQAMLDIAPDFLYLGNDGMKWYGYPEDMRELAARFPECTFLLTGAGEENGDFWRAAFKGDTAEYLRPTVVWPRFEMVGEANGILAEKE